MRGLLGIVGVAPSGIGKYLDPIYHYCDAKNYPKLTILVVNKSRENSKSRENRGMPSTGMPEVNKDNVNEEREEVFQKDWFAIEPPQISDFEKY